jgi:hypothetical protein
MTELWTTELWTKGQIVAERNYRFVERLGILMGSEPATAEAVEIAGAECRAWELEHGFSPASEDERAGQIRLL